MPQYLHHKLVHYVAMTWWRKIQSMNIGLELDDVIQEAYLACLNAEAGFDKSRGWAFSTYFVSTAKHHFWNLLQKAIREKPVNVEIVDENALFSTIEDNSSNPADMMSAAQCLVEAIISLSPLARLMIDLLIAPPASLKAEFFALEAKRELIREARVDERHPQQLDIAFISSILIDAGVSQAMIKDARNEIKKLETAHEL